MSSQYGEGNSEKFTFLDMIRSGPRCLFISTFTYCACLGSLYIKTRFLNLPFLSPRIFTWRKFCFVSIPFLTGDVWTLSPKQRQHPRFVPRNSGAEEGPNKLNLHFLTEFWGLKPRLDLCRGLTNSTCISLLGD